jgi:hypothetical protein
MVKNLPTVERSTKIRFGKYALDDQAENTIVFNASNTEMQVTNPGAVYLSPIRFREDFSDPQIVLLMYDKTTGEITESGSSASTATEPPLRLVTGFGNTTPHTIEFNNPTTSFKAASNVQIQSLSENSVPIVGASNVLIDSPITKSGDKMVITSNLEVLGNVQFSNGTITEIKNTDLVVEDRIIGIANGNTQSALDIGIVMNYPDKNVAIIHHGDETPKRLSVGYTQNTHTDSSIAPDSNNITVDILGDLKVQNDLNVNGRIDVANLSITQSLDVDTNTLKVDSVNNRVGIGITSPTVALDVSGDANVAALTATTGTFSSDVSGVAGTFTGAVSGTTGTFTGAVSGASITDGTATLSGGTWSGSAATLTTARLIGGVAFDGSTDINLPGVDIGGNQNTTGSAATLTTARLIGGVAFDGSADINLPGVDIGGNQNTTGSAATLTTARLIGGVAFDGSADINLPGVDIGGNQNTTGSAATLTTARLIGGVAFDGSADINLPGVDTGGNQNTTGSAATLTTARLIGGVAFDGSADIVPTTFNSISAIDGTFSGNVSGVNGTFTGPVTGASYSGGAISGTTGTFSGTLSSAGFTATSAQINGVLNTVGNLSVNTNAILVDATNKKVGIGKTPGANLDVLGNVYASGAITSAAGGITATTGLISGDGGGLSNLQVSSFASDVTLGTDTSGDYVASLVGGDGITTGAAAESATPTVAVDLKTNGGLVIETGQVAVDLAASSITGTLAVADGGTGVTTSTGTTNVVLSDSPTLTGTLTAATANFSGDISAVGGTFTGAVTGASYSGGAISGTTGTYTGALTVTDSTASVSNVTGSLVVSGGIGAIGNVYSGDLYASAGLDHSSHIGTARIGYDGTTTGDATFAETNNMNSTDYAIKQDSAGKTKINAKTGQVISFGINNVEKAQISDSGNFSVDTNTLYVDAVNDRVGIGTITPAANKQLDVVGNIYASQNVTAAGSFTTNRATVTDGLIVNAGGVTKKFYSYNGTIPTGTTPANAAIKLTFSSNIFYAKIVAHLVEDATEFSNMSLEVGGGSRAGGSSPNLKLGSVSVFGNTSTNPWNSTPDVTTTAGAIIIKPSSDINNGTASVADALYNIFIEYITPDATNGTLNTIHQGANAAAVKTFNY